MATNEYRRAINADPTTSYAVHQGPLVLESKMRTLEIQGTTGLSTIMVGEKLENLTSHIPVDKFVIITDENVGRIYGKNFPPCEVVEISMGEKIKNNDTLQYIYGKLLDFEADRSVFIAGVGGGIVCDITGFVASTYLRGVRFGFVFNNAPCPGGCQCGWEKRGELPGI